MAEIRIKEGSPTLHVEFLDDEQNARRVGTVGHVQLNWEKLQCKVDREKREIRITLS